MENTPVLTNVRLYIGGISEDILEEDIHKVFGQYGKISDIEFVRHKDIAYIQIDDTTEELVKKCLAVYKKVKWKGRTMKVEYAQPNYLARMQKKWLIERDENDPIVQRNKIVVIRPKVVKKKPKLPPPVKNNGVVMMFKYTGEESDSDVSDDEDETNRKVDFEEMYSMNKDYSYFHLVKDMDEKIYEVAETETKSSGFKFLQNRSNEDTNDESDSEESNKKRKRVEEPIVKEKSTFVSPKKVENKFLPIFSFMFAETNTGKRKNHNKDFENHLKEIVSSGDSFRRVESLDNVKEQWRNNRSFLRKDAKKKHKHSVKKTRTMQIRA